MHAAAQNLQVLEKNFVKQKIHPIFEVLWEDPLSCEMEIFLPKYWVSNKFYLTPFIRYRKGERMDETRKMIFVKLASMKWILYKEANFLLLQELSCV